MPHMSIVFRSGSEIKLQSEGERSLISLAIPCRGRIGTRLDDRSLRGIVCGKRIFYDGKEARLIIVAEVRVKWRDINPIGE